MKKVGPPRSRRARASKILLVAAVALVVGFILGAGNGLLRREVVSVPEDRAASVTPTSSTSATTSTSSAPAPSSRTPKSFELSPSASTKTSPSSTTSTSATTSATRTTRTTPAVAETTTPRRSADGGRRGLWVVRHSMRNPDVIDQVVAAAAEIGADTLFVQVNGRMEAYYRSTLLPPAPDATPNFDALEYIIGRAHAEGIEVHAWINAFTAGMLTETPVHSQHVLNRRPEWVTVDRTGRSLWDYGWEEAQIHVPARMLDPGLPAVQQFVFDVILEVVDAYDVDGIHLDYVRYPSRRFGYHPESVRRFADEYGFDPMELQQDAVAFVARHGRDELQRRLDQWDGWRRRQVTSLVERIGRAIASRGEYMFSIAVAADAGDAVTERLQDWPTWMEHRLVDAVVLMAYSADTERVAAHVAHAVDIGQRTGVPVYTGIGAYLLGNDSDLLRRQVQAARAGGTAGVAIFSYDTLVEQPHFKETLPTVW